MTPIYPKLLRFRFVVALQAFLCKVLSALVLDEALEGLGFVRGAGAEVLTIMFLRRTAMVTAPMAGRYIEAFSLTSSGKFYGHVSTFCFQSTISSYLL